MVEIKKVKKVKQSSNKKIATVIASLMVVSALGVININKDKHINVGIQDGEDVYVTEAVTYEDFVAYTEMINYEIEASGGSVDLEDIEMVNGVVNQKSVINKLNDKFSRREPTEIEDLTERKKYKLSKDILIKKSENMSVDYLMEIFTSEEPISEIKLK